MVNNNILHFLRSYGYHGGEKQIYKITNTKIKNYNHYFLDLHYNLMFKKKFNDKTIDYNYLLPFDFKNINLFIELIIIIILLPYLLIKLFKLIHSKKIDLIFSHNFQSAIILLPMALIYRKQIKLVYFHRIYKKYRKYDFISPLIYYSFDMVLCNSDSVKQSLKRYTNKNIHVVKNYVEKNFGNYEKTDNEIIFITVSRLEKRKNIKFLIDVFTELYKDYKNISFYVVGDGTQEKNLKQYSRTLGNEKIFFLGRREDVIKLLKKSSIYICASELEGMSNSLLEAMSVGVPSVIVNSKSVSECHIDNYTALFSKKNKSNFKEKCETLILDKKLRTKLSLNSLKHVRNNFNFEYTLKTYIKIYDTLLM